MQVGSKTIMLVDDHFSVLSIYTNVLQREGFTVLTARDAEGASDTAEQYLSPIDLLIVDIFLPSQRGRSQGLFQRPPRNGLELAQRVQKTRPHAVALFISGHEDKDIQALGGLPPGAKFLRKPFTTPAFLEVVRQALALPLPDSA